MREGTFESLCRDPVYYLQNVDDFNRVIGKIEKNILTIRCEDANCSARINWMVVAERKDKEILDSSTTNENGRLVTEISDTSTRVKKDGSNYY